MMAPSDSTVTTLLVSQALAVIGALIPSSLHTLYPCTFTSLQKLKLRGGVATIMMITQRHLVHYVEWS